MGHFVKKGYFLKFRALVVKHKVNNCVIVIIDNSVHCSKATIHMLTFSSTITMAPKSAETSSINPDSRRWRFKCTHNSCACRSEGFSRSTRGVCFLGAHQGLLCAS